MQWKFYSIILNVIEAGTIHKINSKFITKKVVFLFSKLIFLL